MRTLCFAALLLTVAPLSAQTEQSEDAKPSEEKQLPEFDAVLVTGEQPGPGLWRVTKGDHTMWILGTYGPLPKKMTWRSRVVEDIIAESQRVIRWPRIETDVDVGFFAAMAALPSLVNAGDNPDGKKLQEVVPTEAYAQWLPLKEKYIGRDKGIEQLRPAFAALQLTDEARKEVGFGNRAIIWPTVEKLAKKHKVKIVQPEIKLEIKIEKPRATIKKFRKTPLADVECFTQTLGRLEDDLDILRARANAWAVGKMEVLRHLPTPDPTVDCGQMLQQAMLNGTLADDLGVTEMRDRAMRDLEQSLTQQRELWLQAVEESMQVNTSTLALAPIEVLLDKKGPLATLQERGYSVDEP